MELAEADETFGEEGLIIGGARLIESDGAGGGAARRKKKTGAGIHGIKRVALKRSVAVIDKAAKGKGATLKHRVLAPFQTRAKINAAVIELLIAKGGAGREGAIRCDIPRARESMS